MGGFWWIFQTSGCVSVFKPGSGDVNAFLGKINRGKIEDGEELGFAKRQYK